MKHATAATLDQLDSLLAELRRLTSLTERSRGVFYRKGRAFLHFHEDPLGLFADIRGANGRDFERFDVTRSGGREGLLELARKRAS
ncbi:hypothetical protein [Phenylobacterium sp.]|jgi:hypothetical protein|uniref:hypothetical protein n=1 Tax=Phenylobacterium sp. TaxID=1871053 RepID=UPI0037C6B686